MNNDAPTTYNIPEANYFALVAKIEKLNRRATKLGVPPVSLVKHGEKLVEEKDSENIFGECVRRKYIIMSIHGEAPKLAGYTFIGRIDRTLPGLPLVMTVPGQEMPASYREAVKPWCDHCKTARYRKDTFVVRHESGKHLEIGRNCLKDFLGNQNPEHIIAMMTTILSAVKDAEDEQGRGWGSHCEYEIATAPLLAMTNAIIREFGWCSRGEAQNTGGTKVATADRLHPQIFGRAKLKPIEKITPDERDHEIAQKTLDYVKNVLAQQPNPGDYVYNLVTLCGYGTIPAAKMGIVASAVSSYQRWAGEQVKRAYEKTQKAASQHFGTVGERIVFDATFMRVHYIETAYGSTAICEFITKEGNVVKWFATNDPEFKHGVTYKLKATIKDHKVYRDICETIVNRAVILGQEKAA